MTRPVGIDGPATVWALVHDATETKTMAAPTLRLGGAVVVDVGVVEHDLAMTLSATSEEARSR